MSIAPPPPLPSPSNQPIRLAKVATLLAVILAITFGLCTVTAISGKVGSALSSIIATSLVIEVVCLVGLTVIGVVAVARALSRKTPN